MISKKRISGEKKKPNSRQSVVKKERRETPRGEPQTPTEAQFDYSGNKYADRILEVSPGGCKITTDAPLRVGDVIKFKSPAAISGRVVWSRMGSFGIEFIDETAIA